MKKVPIEDLVIELLKKGRQDPQFKFSNKLANELDTKMKEIIKKIDEIIQKNPTSYQRSLLNLWKSQIQEQIISKIPILKDPEWLKKQKAGPGPG